MTRREQPKAKTQKGPPFISDPGCLVFRDFVVGETMNIPFTLTNVSFGRNTYKVVGFDKEYESLFKLNFSPPGYVSPGVSVKLSLDFTPRFNSQIRCVLRCQAETGPFEVIVECLPKVVNIQIDPFDVVDLGMVTLGEEVEHTLTLRNSGALMTVWALSLETMPVDAGFLSLQEAEDGVVQFNTKHGTVPGYRSTTVRVTFKPARPGQLRFTLRFKFSSQQNEFDAFVKEIPLEGIGSDVPVFLEPDRIDFGVCYFNELYRTTLVAHNRSGISQRFVIQAPPNLDKFVDFMPKLGFIQPQSSLQIAIKVRMTNKFAAAFPQFEKTADIPVIMEVVNQVLPVNFALSFTPSSLKLVFDPPTLDFGTFLTTECREMPLRITSMMQLPSDFGFVRLPNGVSVQPFDGFGLVMPGESVDVSVGFQSQVAKKHDFVVTVMTLQAQKFVIPCTATVIAPPLQISETDIAFEATPLGQDSSYKVILTNSRPTALDFEMETVEDFLFDPVVATIPANSSVSVFVTFRPNVPTQEPEKPVEEEAPVVSAKPGKKDAKKHSKSHSKDKKRSETAKSAEVPASVISNDFTFKTYEKSVSCFYRVGSTTGRHHIMVRAAAVLPTLYVMGVSINKVDRRSEDYIDLSLNRVDFGIVCTGQSMDAIVDIRSVIKKNLDLEFECERGSFEVLSPSTTIRSMQTTQVRLRFTPSSNMKFTSTVTIFCPDRPNARIVMRLSGEGAAPSIQLSQDSLEMGSVVVGHTIARSVKVKNNASFALEYVYDLHPTGQMHCKNMSGSDAFSIVTRKQWLKPQEQGEVIVTFAPDHDDLNFMSVLVISAGADGENREVAITASAWPHVMYIMGGVEEPQQRTAFDHYALDEPYFRPSVLCEMSYPGAGAQATLTFGVCNQNDDIKKTNGDLTFDGISTPGFTVTPPKSGVEAGGVTKVTIEYVPPASSLLQVGQWVVADTAVNLKCADFMRKVPVRLKCLINLQQTADLTATASVRQGKGTRQAKKRK